MSTITEQVSEQVRQRLANEKNNIAEYKSRALDFILEVAVRELNYESRPTDAIDLLTALEDHGLTLDDYNAALEGLKQVARLNHQRDESIPLVETLDLVRLKRQQTKKRFDVELDRLRRQFNACENAVRIVHGHAYELERLSRQYPMLFVDGNLREAALAIKAPAPVPVEPTKQCKFCTIDFPASTKGSYCGFPCQRDGEALEALLPPTKGKK